MKNRIFAFWIAVAAFSIQHSAFSIAAAATAAADPVDLKPLALECYGVRGAAALNSNTVVAVIGASCLGNRDRASAWRITSEEDPAYAYEKFVRPAKAKALPEDVEFALPSNFGAPGPAQNPLKRHLVVLTLPEALRPGVRYGLVAGLDALVTGAKSGCYFSWDGRNLPTDEPENVRVPADDLAPRLVGLRRASPLGDGKIALEFGASFSSSAWRNTDQWDVRVNGEPVEPAAFGRRSRIDVYFPIGWPYKVFLEHDVFLDLGRELKDGDRVTVAVGERICSGAREASFVFDPSRTISRAIKANQVGYLPDGPKVAYLGFWLASFPEAAKAVKPSAGAASSDSDFDYATPPTAAEVFFIAPPEEEVEELKVEKLNETALSTPSTVSTASTPSNVSTSYDDLAPYALRFREPPAFELVREKDGRAVFRGVARLAHNGLLPDGDGETNHSAENVYTLDFTDFAEPGRYYLRVAGVGRSIAFDIAPDAYLRAFRVQAAGVYAQRCGCELTPDHAPGWCRIACHTNGVVLTTVRAWDKLSGMGPLRKNPVLVPNPAYPAFAAAQSSLYADPALVARFPLDGALTNAVAGSAVTLAPLAEKKPGGTFVDDERLGAKVFRTGRKNNGLGGTFAVDPTNGATAVFWFRRDDPDGYKYVGDLLRIGPACLEVGYGMVSLGKNWKRLGDDRWRQLVVRVNPKDDLGRTTAQLFENDAFVSEKVYYPPRDGSVPTALAVGRVSDDSAAGCHYRDLRLFARALTDEDISTLAADVPPTLPKTVPLRGGHHDAGDYNPRCHIEVAQRLLSAWELAPRKFADGQLDIPEAGNGLPDIVDEALWALRAWRFLQEEDGGVRDGTESQGDPGFAQTVELDPTGDYAYEKSCKASFLFAGAFAQASRVLAACGRGKEAADYLARARRAYDWGVANVPDGLRSLGQFAEYRMTTRAYAAAELLHTTGDRKYLANFRDTTPWAIYPDAPVREDKRGHYEAQLAAFAFARDPENEKRDPEIWARVKAAVLREADYYIEGSDQMAYKFVRHPAAPIVWGIGAYGNFLPPVVNAWFLTGDRKYRDWTIRTCDNMLGANPLGLSWIVGLGERCNRAPLHSSRFRPEGVAVDGFQGEGPNVHGNGYNYKETVYPAHKPGFAILYAFSDNTFSLPMTEGLVIHQALDMAVLGLLLPDAE